MGRFKIPVSVALFVGIWLLIFCLPVLRQIPRSLVLYRQVGSDENPAYHGPSAQLARAIPDNATAALYAASTLPYDADKTNLRRVVARFPNDWNAQALGLRETAGLVSSIEAMRQNKDPKKIEIWREAVEIARQGGQHEPSNAFWPWMEAGFEFGLGHDSAAYSAMRRASSCSDFNDYLFQDYKARFALLDRYVHPTFEEKIIASVWVLYSHWSLMADATKTTAQRALELKQSGNATGALELENAVLNVYRVRHASSESLYESAIAEGQATRSLEKVLGIPKPREPGPTSNGSYIWVDPAIHGAELARAWADLARKNGRPQLANSAAWMAEPSTRREFNNYDEVNDWVQFGMKAPWSAIAVVGPIVLLGLALLIATGALAWTLIYPVSWRGAAPARGAVVACANFSFWLGLGLGALVLAKFAMFLNPMMSYAGSETLSTWLPLYSLILSLLCWLSPVWFLGWKRGRRWKLSRPANTQPLPSFWNHARITAWIFSALGAMLVYSNGRGLWDDTLFQFPYALWIASVGLFVALSLELARWNLAGARVSYGRFGDAVALKGRARWVPWMLWMLFFAGAGALIRGALLGDIVFDQIVVAVPTVGSLGGALYLGWKLAPDHFRWQLAHRTLGALVLLWSIAFFFLAVGLVPLRAQLNRNFDRRIQLGELAWMREQAARAK